MTESVEPDSPMSSICWSEESEWIDPVIEKFGQDPLVAVIRSPDLVRELVDGGQHITINAILAACDTASTASLKFMMSNSPQISPNDRLHIADENSETLKSGWYNSDITPNIGIEKRKWYPLQCAAAQWKSSASDKEERYGTVQAVLDMQCDIYATLQQPIWHTEPYPYPGEDDGEDCATESYAEVQDRWMARHDMLDGEYQSCPTPECGYGLRSVIHALFEDGAYLKPLLEHDLTSIDLEHRDPQGRTLIHSICRNAVGADAIIDARVQDVDEPPRLGLVADVSLEQSLFHTVRRRGADMLAVDYTGKNILHHLLEARTAPDDDTRPPFVRNTLNYVLEHLPSLVNQPDSYGNQPLHMALQRLRRFPITKTSALTQESPIAAIIQDLLDNGAEPVGIDSRGNTALHYLASCGLAEQFNGTELRDLCRHFLSHRVDVNRRNALGRTALEVLMDDSGAMHKRMWSHNGNWSRKATSLEVIDQEVCDMFDGAGARWTERDLRGRTLLHIVAVHPTERARFRTEYLLAKKIDPETRDNQGRTVADVAQQYRNSEVLEVLQQQQQQQQ